MVISWFDYVFDGAGVKREKPWVTIRLINRCGPKPKGDFHLNFHQKDKIKPELVSLSFFIKSICIMRAKDAGVKLTFGTNNTNANDLGRLEYCLDMIEVCDLRPEDIWIP